MRHGAASAEVRFLPAPAPITGGRDQRAPPCHSSDLMAERKTTAERGYNAQHKAERARWAPKVKTGLVDCARCHAAIAVDEPWDLDHTDDRSGYNGPTHASCNRAAGGRNGAAVTNSAKAMTVRDW